jgi:hypothetical protein
LTGFSGKKAPPIDGANMVTREAYSHEVISFGFWLATTRQFPLRHFIHTLRPNRKTWPAKS